MRWLIWTFAAFFYFYEYILRVSPSTMVPELMASFAINAAGIGTLGGSFFLAYAPMQLPVGMLMDRFGARKLLTFASLGCGMGSILFGLAKGLTLAYIGRIIIGAAASFAFVAMVYVCSHWFEKSKRALLVGLANSIAMLGGLFGEGPLTSFVHAVGWRWAMLILGFIGFGLAFFIFLTIFKHTPSTTAIDEKVPKEEESHSFFEGLKTVALSSQGWINSLIALLYYTTTSALTGLWGISFIQTNYEVSKVTAGYAISMLFVGWMVGGPVSGAVSDRLGNRKKVLSACIFFTTAALCLIIYWTSIPIYLVYAFLFLIGFFSSAQLLNFTFATEINPKHIKGVAIAWTNFIVAIGSGLIIPIIGWLLDLFADPLRSYRSLYTSHDFKIALTILPICLIVAWILTFFLNEKKRDEEHFSPNEPMG